MNARTIRTAVLAAALVLLAILPAAALGVQNEAIAGRQVAPSQEISTFFQDRGVDPQYLTKPQSEVPAAQWAKIEAIVSTPDVADSTTDDHDVLNSLVAADLYNATTTVGDTVYMTIGNSVWSHHLMTSDE